MLDQIDRALIARVCDDLGDSLYPFRAIADELHITEEEVLMRLTRLREQGILRRFGAILRHQRAGFVANGMSVWDVPQNDVERVGERMTACPEISHCYERQPLPDWPYNMYAMIHATTREACEAIAAGLAEELGIERYRVLFSVREFKKTSMQYLAKHK
ncbi:MAG: siroheme decarboxylase subunit beta [Armatimonadota bacterium]